MVGGWWSVVGGRWSVQIDPWSVVSGRWSVAWSVVGGFTQRRKITDEIRKKGEFRKKIENKLLKITIIDKAKFVREFKSSLGVIDKPRIINKHGNYKKVSIQVGEIIE